MEKIKNNIINILLLSFLPIAKIIACPVCERNKPKILQGVVHGSSPESSLDYFIVVAMILVTTATLFYSVKWLIKPNEDDKSHIKHSFLNNI